MRPPVTPVPALRLPEPRPDDDLASIRHVATGLDVHERDIRQAISNLGIVPRFRFNTIDYFTSEQWRDIHSELYRLGAFPEQRKDAK